MIREAISSDKHHILEFCQNTFSWGDYIDNVWDYWISEGILLVYVKNNPIVITSYSIHYTKLYDSLRRSRVLYTVERLTIGYCFFTT